MKNLKKILALVLVLVTVVGMLGVSASAFDLSKYSDSSSITYGEAIEVMSEIGVIDGFDDGTLRPNETLTRAQAAKIVSYLVLGKTAADSLSTTSAPFTDVAASNWAAGAIAYCVSTGIINGYGDGTFGPQDTLTSYQWAKMLLCALGYGVNDEFTGGSWAIEVAKLALSSDVNLYRGNSADANNNAITRQSAMQCALNALRTPKVVWSPLNARYNDETTISGSVRYLTSAHDLARVTVTNKFGYASHKWQVKSKDITGVYVDDIIVGTYTDTDDVTLGQLWNLDDWAETAYTTTTGSGSSATTTTHYGVPVYVNGSIEGYIAIPTKGSSNKLSTIKDLTDLLANSTQVNGAARNSGLQINVVKENVPAGKIYKIVVVEEYLGQVTKVTAATSSAKRTIKVALDRGGSCDIESEDFAVDEWVAVVPEGTNFDDPLSVTAVSSVNATMASRDVGKQTFTVSGTVYRYSSTAYETIGTGLVDDLDFSTTYTFYLSSYGNSVLRSEVYSQGTTASNLLYVDNVEVEAGSSFKSAYLKLAVVYMDGTSAIVEYAMKTAANNNVTQASGTQAISSGDKYVTIDGENYQLDALAANSGSAAAGLLVGNVYSYRGSSSSITLSVVGENNSSSLLSAEVVYPGSLTVTKGDTKVTITGGTVSSLYANNGTVLTLADDGSATSYTGYSNFSSRTYTTATTGSADNTVYNIDAIVIARSGSSVSNILVIGAPAPTPKADSYAYYVGYGSESGDDQYYDFYVNGDMDSRLIASNSPLPDDGKAYGYTIGTDGKVTIIENTAYAGEVTYFSSSVIEIKSGINTYYFERTSATKIYSVVGKPSEFYEGARLTTGGGDDVIVAYSEDSSGNRFAEAVFITSWK